MLDYSYYFAWRNNPSRAALWHRPCRIVTRGAMNTVLVEFTDGAKVTTSGNALRKFSSVGVAAVTIPACDEHQGVFAKVVRLRWVCLVCGQPRGKVYPTISWDGSRRLGCDGWINPCGHVDYYCDVREEAKENGLN